MRKREKRKDRIYIENEDEERREIDFFILIYCVIYIILMCCM